MQLFNVVLGRYKWYHRLVLPCSNGSSVLEKRISAAGQSIRNFCCVFNSIHVTQFNVHECNFVFFFGYIILYTFHLFSVHECNFVFHFNYNFLWIIFHSTQFLYTIFSSFFKGEKGGNERIEKEWHFFWERKGKRVIRRERRWKFRCHLFPPKIGRIERETKKKDISTIDFLFMMFSK